MIPKWARHPLVSLGGMMLWLASLVEVFSFTYQSFKDTYKPFPIGKGTGVGTALPGPGQPIPKGTPGSGGTPLEPAPVPSGPKVKAPPASIIDPLITAVNQHNRYLALRIWNTQLLKWGTTTPGWKDAGGPPGNSVLVWISSQPWGSSFFDLTGLGYVLEQ